jgi:drug/metabolite transporter (DMT)-like permease
MLFIILKKRLGDFQIKPVLASFVRVLLASLCMGVVCYFVSQETMFSYPGTLNKLLNLGLALISGVLSYIVFCLIFRVEEMRELWRWVGQRKQA